jgi:hypothetical protein
MNWRGIGFELQADDEARRLQVRSGEVSFRYEGLRELGRRMAKERDELFWKAFMEAKC